MPIVIVAGVTGLSIPKYLVPLITDSVKENNPLNIILISSSFIPNPATWKQVQAILTFVYFQATKLAHEQDDPLLEINVALFPSCKDIPKSLVKGWRSYVPIGLSQEQLLTLPACFADLGVRSGGPHEDLSLNAPALPTPSAVEYPVVALGGTFDHLHAGHKILLSLGAWIASEKLIVGVTDDALLVNKAHKSELQPLETRLSRVKRFLTNFRPSITYEIVPINDVYGPTGWDPNINALVLSKETLSGAASISAHRASKGLPQLEPFVIDVISATESSLDGDPEALKAAKMSSTFIRGWIVEHKKKKAW